MFFFIWLPLRWDVWGRSARGKESRKQERQSRFHIALFASRFQLLGWRYIISTVKGALCPPRHLTQSIHTLIPPQNYIRLWRVIPLSCTYVMDSIHSAMTKCRFRCSNVQRGTYSANHARRGQSWAPVLNAGNNADNVCGQKSFNQQIRGSPPGLALLA